MHHENRPVAGNGEEINPPRGDALTVPFWMDINIDDVPGLFGSIIVEQSEITEPHVDRPGAVISLG